MSQDQFAAHDLYKKNMSELLGAAREAIDDEFGNGYAERHPHLVGHCMIAAALESGARSIDYVSYSINSVAGSLRS